MTILFLLENTADAPEGGTEISSRHLASLLCKRGTTVIEWAPYQRRRSPFWYTSLLMLPFLVLKILFISRQENITLIHVQGKYLVPVGVIVARLLRIPAVVTIRDYFIFCPIGLCLFDEIKRHGFFFFVKKEISDFLRTYHQSDSLMFRNIRLILLTRAWFVSKWLRWWTRKADSVIAVSTYVSLVLKKYGISSRVIYNCFDVSKYRNIIKSDSTDRVSPRKDIVFVGKESYGKGSDLFDAMSKKKEFSTYRFVKITTDRWTPYENVLRVMRDALVTVVPSRWQEPFGRVALESLMVGTPVVATRRGGLSEIVKDRRNGLFADPTVSSLSKALHEALEDNQRLRDAVRRNRQPMYLRFSSQPVEQHLTLYREALGKIGHR